MKEIVKNYYNIFFGLTGIKKTSYYIAIVLVSCMCIIVLSGLVRLLEGLIPRFINIGFIFPYYFATLLLIIYLISRAANQMRVIYKENDKKVNVISILLTLIITASAVSYMVFLHYEKVETIGK